MNEVQQKIIHEAVKLFSSKGYHGTSMRDIMKAAGCTQPTLYYYFDNKQVLFKESVLGEFQRMMNQVIGDVDASLPVKDIYVNAVIKRKHFSDYQKQVYRLAIQGWYHLLGDEETETQLCDWVHKVIDLRKDFLARHINDPKRLEIFTSLLMHTFLNMTEQIILKDMDISDEEITQRFTMLFELF
jgi:AcrR family transcriptional regulator